MENNAAFSDVQREQLGIDLGKTETMVGMMGGDMFNRQQGEIERKLAEERLQAVKDYVRGVKVVFGLEQVSGSAAERHDILMRADMAAVRLFGALDNSGNRLTSAGVKRVFETIDAAEKAEQPRMFVDLINGMNHLSVEKGRGLIFTIVGPDASKGMIELMGKGKEELVELYCQGITALQNGMGPLTPELADGVESFQKKYLSGAKAMIF